LYSQSDEEEVILRLLGDTPGVLLDVGAWDGMTFSNSLALIEKGWQAVMVEPSCYAFKMLLERHGENPRINLVNALVGLENGLVPFWNSRGDGVSTTEAAHREAWAQAVPFNGPAWLPQVTFADLFHKFPILADAQFVSIDTEGTAERLFSDLIHCGLFTPRVICVEYTGDGSACVGEAFGMGYVLAHKTRENVILVKQ
jgi:FkbM family methyltransferase